MVVYIKRKVELEIKMDVRATGNLLVEPEIFFVYDNSSLKFNVGNLWGNFKDKEMIMKMGPRGRF